MPLFSRYLHCGNIINAHRPPMNIESLNSRSVYFPNDLISDNRRRSIISFNYTSNDFQIQKVQIEVCVLDFNHIPIIFKHIFVIHENSMDDEIKIKCFVFKLDVVFNVWWDYLEFGQYNRLGGRMWIQNWYRMDRIAMIFGKDGVRVSSILQKSNWTWKMEHNDGLNDINQTTIEHVSKSIVDPFFHHLFICWREGRMLWCC